MRLKFYPECKDQDCDMRRCIRTRIKRGREDITVFGIEYTAQRQWRVWVSSKDGRSYHARWRLCKEHDAELMKDFERIGRDEVNEYNATISYLLGRRPW